MQLVFFFSFLANEFDLALAARGQDFDLPYESFTSQQHSLKLHLKCLTVLLNEIMITIKGMRSNTNSLICITK